MEQELKLPIEFFYRMPVLRIVKADSFCINKILFLFFIKVDSFFIMALKWMLILLTLIFPHDFPCKHFIDEQNEPFCNKI